LRPGWTDPNSKSLPSQKVKDKRDDDANDNTSRERKIERKTIALDRNIAGQMTEPRQFIGE
jgi:hypothetical protein